MEDGYPREVEVEIITLRITGKPPKDIVELADIAIADDTKELDTKETDVTGLKPVVEIEES